MHRLTPVLLAAFVLSWSAPARSGEHKRVAVAYPKGADLSVISHQGEDVRVVTKVAKGKVTVVDFYADWCKPCTRVDRRLAKLVADNLDDLAVRKVNIVSMSRPVAKRYLNDATGVPYVRIYDERGKFVMALSGDEVKQLDRHVERLLAD